MAVKPMINAIISMVSGFLTRVLLTAVPATLAYCPHPNSSNWPATLFNQIISNNNDSDDDTLIIYGIHPESNTG